MRITWGNYREAARRCLELSLRMGRPVYFSVAYWGVDGVTACYFAPVAPVKEGEWALFSLDYEKILVMLLTHPRVRDIWLDEEEGAVKLAFEAPEEEE